MTKDELLEVLREYILNQPAIAYEFPTSSESWYKLAVKPGDNDPIAAICREYFDVDKTNKLLLVSGNRCPGCPEIPYKAALKQLPAGVSLPTEIKIKHAEESLYFEGVMTEAEQKKLLGLSTDKNYQVAVKSLYDISHKKIRRVFIGDLLWLFYYEQMGNFKIIGRLLDDFATRGKWPIGNHGETADILENAVIKTKQGISSSVRDRTSSYQRCLGWTSEAGRKLGVKSEVNEEFNTSFRSFLYTALTYYKDKRLAVAIQAAGTPGKPSIATLVTIRDNITLLKNSFEKFEKGRNHTNTVNGILWIIMSMALCRDLREVFVAKDGEPYKYLAKIYEALELGPEKDFRYLERKECAVNGRRILLELEGLNHEDTTDSGALKTWLDHAENLIEGYRTAFLGLTGIDLGMEDVISHKKPKIPQQA